MNSDGLWKRALDDADLDHSAVRRVVLEGGARTSRYAQHFPPGTTARPTMTDLTDEEAAEIDSDTTGHRVAHVSTVDHEPGLLGVIRVQLEHVRQWDAQQGNYRLTPIGPLRKPPGLVVSVRAGRFSHVSAAKVGIRARAAR